MRPRTKLQREVAALSSTLPPLNAKQEAFAQKHSHKRIGYFSVGEVWCTHCGKFTGQLDPMASRENGEEYVCPFCGEKLTIKRATNKKYNEKRYVTYITTCGRWQVFRHFVTYWSVRKGRDPHSWTDEAVQIWLNEEGQEVIMARPCTIYGGDSWDFCKPMEIRTRYRSYYDYRGQKYNVWTDYIYPDYKVLPVVKRNGFNLTAAKDGMPPCRLMLALLSDTEAEFLVKTRQYSLLNYFKYKREIKCGRYMPSIKICVRNGYKVKDASMWVDYIDLLEYFHLDTRNAHYVCPKNLKKEHDKLMTRKNRVEAKRKAEEARKNAKQWEAEYKAKKGMYFGICFGNEDIQIAVITSVADIADEGEAMHHCVYSNRYFNKDNSLILSARDKEGNRLETIELDLRTLEIVQSRGKCNGTTPYHDQIVSLVKDNIGLFRKAA